MAIVTFLAAGIALVLAPEVPNAELTQAAQVAVSRGPRNAAAREEGAHRWNERRRAKPGMSP